MDESLENLLSTIIKKENFIEVDAAQLSISTFENDTSNSINARYVACEQQEEEILKLKNNHAIETYALDRDPPIILHFDNHTSKDAQLLIGNNHVVESVDNTPHYSIKLKNNHVIETSALDMDPPILDLDNNHTNEDVQLLVENNQVMKSVDNIPNYSPECIEMKILESKNIHSIKTSAVDLDSAIILDLDNNHTNKNAQLLIENNQIMESVYNTHNYSPKCIEMEVSELKNNRAIQTSALDLDPPIILDLHVYNNHRNKDPQLLIENNEVMVSVDDTPHYSRNCIKNMTTKISQNDTNLEEILEDTFIDTESVSKAVRFYLSFNKIRWGKFSSLVLGITQGRLSVLLKKPKPWNQLTRRIQSYYCRMKYWLDYRATYILKKEKKEKITKNREVRVLCRKQKKKSQEQYELDKNHFEVTKETDGLLLTHSNSQKLELEESNEDTIAATFIAALNEQEVNGKNSGESLSNLMITI